jgi:hypothetical protein
MKTEAEHNLPSLFTIVFIAVRSTRFTVSFDSTAIRSNFCSATETAFLCAIDVSCHPQ